MKNCTWKTWIHVGVFALLSTAAIVGCSSKQAKVGDNMGVTGSSASSSLAQNSSGSSANLGAASSGNSR